VLTIGYGHTGKDVKAGMVITGEQAAELLRQDMASAVACVNNNALPCTQGQFDALVDFVFNLGANQFLRSTLLRKHRAGDYVGAAKEFGRWVYDNKKKLPGLVTRREKERKLYVGS
jgi:lysozyme